jgi:hypothetical protein
LQLWARGQRSHGLDDGCDGTGAGEALARLLVRRARPIEARAHLLRLAALLPDDAETLGLLAWTELRLDRPVAAGALIEHALAIDPRAVAARFTHALALLKADRAADALGVFHDVDIFVDQLPPGDKAVVIALWETNGMNTHAASLRRSLDPALLQPDEFALIAR